MTKARVAVLISGAGSNMAALLYASRAETSPYEIVLVASNNPGAPGLRLAEAEGIPTYAHSHKGMERAAFDELLHKQLRAARADYVALAGYMRLLTPEFVSRWEGRMLNVHPSLLPLHKGLHPQQQAIDAGDKESGCSVHFVIPGVDEGPTILQRRVPIQPGDTADTLAARILVEEHRAYPEALAMLARGDVSYTAS